MSKQKDIKDGLKASTDKFALPAITALVAANPYLLASWLVVQGFFGVLFQFKQDEINEIVEFIRDNPESFTQKLTETKSFRDGFVITFESYLKERLLKKRKTIQRIFLGFTNSDDRERFELERFYKVVSQISYEGVKYLKFIKSKIVPLFEERNEALAEKTSKESDRDKEWWIKFGKKNECISDDISSWIHDNFDPNSEKVKSKYKLKEDDKELLGEIYEKMQPKVEEQKEISGELLSLGIFRTEVVGIGTIGGGGGQKYAMTEFGWRLLEFIEEEAYN